MTTFIQHMVVLIWNSTEYTYLRKTKCYGPGANLDLNTYIF